MTSDGSHWDIPRVLSLFPTHVSTSILNTPILLMEQDRLVWTPSTTGEFSVKFTYKFINQSGRVNCAQAPHPVWKIIWSSNLHSRHQLLMWKIAHPCGLPWIDFVSSSRYLTIVGKRWKWSIILYWSVKLVEDFGGIRHGNPTRQLQEYGSHHWIQMMLGPDCPIPLLGDDKERLQTFMAVLLERLWMIRNALWQGQPTPDWNLVSHSINSSYIKYWTASKVRAREAKSLLNSKEILSWEPPPPGDYKNNFDASFRDGHATIGCVLHNSHGMILKAWVNYLDSENSY